MSTRSSRIFNGNKNEHNFSLHLEMRGYLTMHPPKAVAEDCILDAPEFRDSFDFLFYRPDKGLRAAMVKAHSDLNGFSVNHKYPDPLEDLLDANHPILLDPISKWNDKTDERWWEQRIWFVCDKQMTFAIAVPGSSHGQWKEEVHTVSGKTQPWWVLTPTCEMTPIHLKDGYHHSNPSSFTTKDLVDAVCLLPEILD